MIEGFVDVVMLDVHHQAVTPDGRYVFSTHPISVVDMQTNQVIKTVETGSAPNYTVITRDGKRAYVTNSGNGTMSQIDLDAWRVARPLEGGPAAKHVVLSAETGKVVGTHKIGANLHGPDIDGDGKTLFVSSVTDNKLAALDPRIGTQRTLTLSPDPYHLNTIYGTGKIYVSSRSVPTLWAVDHKTLKLTGTIKPQPLKVIRWLS